MASLYARVVISTTVQGNCSRVCDYFEEEQCRLAKNAESLEIDTRYGQFKRTIFCRQATLDCIQEGDDNA